MCILWMNYVFFFFTYFFFGYVQILYTPDLPWNCSLNRIHICMNNYHQLTRYHEGIVLFSFIYPKINNIHTFNSISVDFSLTSSFGIMSLNNKYFHLNVDYR